MTRVSSGIVTCADGSQWWRENDAWHRIGGPAITFADGAQRWYENGKLHRVGGSAVTFLNATRWWLEKGRRVTEKRRYDARACSYWRMVV